MRKTHGSPERTRNPHESTLPRAFLPHLRRRTPPAVPYAPMRRIRNSWTHRGRRGAREAHRTHALPRARVTHVRRLRRDFLTLPSRDTLLE
jgi:hypothetical protein